MSILLVSRHLGTLDWFQRQGIAIDQTIAHLDVESVQPGDIVVGTLPIQLAAAVCAKGARYVHLEVNVPFEYRGRELSAALLDQFNAKLTEFKVTPVESTDLIKMNF